MLNKLYEFAPGSSSSSSLAQSDVMTASQLVQTIRDHTLKLYASHLRFDGSAVDYAGANSSSAFIDFEIVTCELQRVPIAHLEQLDKVERMAMFINLYNALVVR